MSPSKSSGHHDKHMHARVQKANLMGACRTLVLLGHLIKQKLQTNQCWCCAPLVRAVAARKPLSVGLPSLSS